MDGVSAFFLRFLRLFAAIPGFDSALCLCVFVPLCESLFACIRVSYSRPFAVAIRGYYCTPSISKLSRISTTTNGREQTRIQQLNGKHFLERAQRG